MKGQMFTTDLVASMVIFLTVLNLGLFALDQSTTGQAQFSEQKRMAQQAYQTADLLARTPGYPSEWDSTNPQVIGFASSNNVLDPTKLREFSRIPYLDQQELLKVLPQEFYIFIGQGDNATIINGTDPPDDFRQNGQSSGEYREEVLVQNDDWDQGGNLFVNDLQYSSIDEDLGLYTEGRMAVDNDVSFQDLSGSLSVHTFENGSVGGLIEVDAVDGRVDFWTDESLIATGGIDIRGVTAPTTIEAGEIKVDDTFFTQTDDDVVVGSGGMIDAADDMDLRSTGRIEVGSRGDIEVDKRFAMDADGESVVYAGGNVTVQNEFYIGSGDKVVLKVGGDLEALDNLEIDEPPDDVYIHVEGDLSVAKEFEIDLAEADVHLRVDGDVSLDKTNVDDPDGQLLLYGEGEYGELEDLADNKQDVQNYPSRSTPLLPGDFDLVFGNKPPDEANTIMTSRREVLIDTDDLKRAEMRVIVWR